ncbi:MAG TPA: DUF1552 domain-containing protein [Isosphaeraceae bacterium]|nr:DUF1552 domain-containing protein [Isosphaeraceae bacterium]
MMHISRRTALRGLGTAMALPWLEAMARPSRAIAAMGPSRGLPTRMAFLYVPNGANMADWTPKAEGRDFDLPFILEPVKAHKDDLLVLTGLTQDHARPHGDGGGDHARALSSFLTGCQPRKTDGADIKVGVSVDQVAAERVGNRTRLPSLELGCDRGPQSGNCDSGYSCAYSANISWRNESSPTSKEINPRLAFERLFAAEDPHETLAGRARRAKYRQSILDLVAEDANALKNRLGANDRRKLDEYLTSVRELERRIAQVAKSPTDAPKAAKPTGIPEDYKEHIRLMLDLVALAFQGDVTRVATFVFANEGSNKSYAFIGIPEGHHDLSHHGNDAEKKRKIRDINRFHMEQFASFLDKLKGAREGDAPLLDRCMVLYGSGISDGNAHNHNDLPILLAGKGSGTIKPGRHVRYPDETPLNNLYLAMLDRMEAPVDALGDSKGRLPKLDG